MSENVYIFVWGHFYLWKDVDFFNRGELQFLLSKPSLFPFSVIGPVAPDTDIPLREVRQRKNLTSHHVANAPQQINADAEERSRLIANMNQPPKVD